MPLARLYPRLQGVQGSVYVVGAHETTHWRETAQVQREYHILPLFVLCQFLCQVSCYALSNAVFIFVSLSVSAVPSNFCIQTFFSIKLTSPCRGPVDEVILENSQHISGLYFTTQCNQVGSLLPGQWFKGP